MAIITLTTDFGTADGYVGAMKGVIMRAYGNAFDRGRNPERIEVVDIAHDIPPGDIAHGAWVLSTIARQFPFGTIHVVVVDPGVGGARASVVVKGHGYWFVGPDNGVFSYVVDELTDAWAIEHEPFRKNTVSPTFHGRDVFAHAAAAIAIGDPVTDAGPNVRLAGRLPWGSRPAREGRIVHIDRFGNLITDLPAGEAGAAVALAGHVLAVRTTYEDASPGELLAYVGSAGTIEIAVRDGRADRKLGLPRGERVVPITDVAPYR